MIKKGKIKHPTIIFNIGNAESLTNYSDNSFDITTASFVIHGVTKDRRAKMLSEMSRISKSHVIIHDFLGKTPPFIKLLEFLEQSDYKNFKENIINELNNHFSEVSSFQIKDGTGIYFCKKQFST